MLELPGVTLCCVDTVNHALALRALRLSSQGIGFGATRFITDRVVDDAGIEVRLIEPLRSRDEYSQFVLKSLLAHVDTPHVLLVQWDGYAVNPEAWRDDFLGVDYIGAQWFWHTDGMRVGNGGFSLRSRKLLEALQDPRVVLVEAEDVTIGRSSRPLLEREHGIRYATDAQADAFAFEAAYPIGKPFGFHGLFNFSRIVAPDELVALVAHFTPAIARSPQLAQLGRNCLAMAQWKAAGAIFRRILETQPADAAAAAGLATAEANASTMPAVGRNEPCPCGSGKRYKHCHGATGERAGGGVAGPAQAVTPADPIRQRMTSALAAHQRGDTEAAALLYREVLAVEPSHPVAQHYLGVIEYQRHALAAALPLLESSVAAMDTEPEFHNNLGLAYAAADREDDAIAQYRATLALNPQHALAWNNLGLALQSLNEVGQAADSFRRAIAIDPGFAQAHWNLSLALLVAGRFREGFAEYDWRLSLTELGKGRHAFKGPRWNGDDPDGKTLLLYAEQGLGDAIQFARFATPLAAAGARVVVTCVSALQPLLATVPGVAESVATGGVLPAYDAHIALLSLPEALGVTIDSIDATVPYLQVGRRRRDGASASPVGGDARLAIGLAWAGSAAHANDRNRSMPLAALAPLFDIPGTSWQSLQHGVTAASIAAAEAGMRMAPLPEGATLADTAALINVLDLVISVDTSIAHLAGALAKPCWVLLPFAPDWRWLLERDDSPWYPTLRLFRQGALRDWDGVVARVADELARLVTTRTVR
ncbi:MAG: DUF5672 family protein [Betaproteobacteria bacterium]